jgi:F-box and WD-40 domain protein 7
VWNTQTGNMLQTLTAGTTQADMSPLWCVQLDRANGRVYAGASDSAIREWDMITGNIVRKYQDHAGGVKCLQFDRQRLVSGSDDKTIKVFDARAARIAQSIPVIGPVSDLKCSRDMLVMSSKRENEVFLYDLRTLNCLRIFRGHSRAVYCVDFELGCSPRPRVYSGSRDRTILCYDMHSGEILNQLDGHAYTIMSIRAAAGKIVSASADSTIKIWNSKSGHCIQTLRGHTEPVMCAQFDQEKVVSSSADRTVVVWDFLRG